MPIVHDRLAWSRYFKRQMLAFGVSVVLSLGCVAAASHVSAALFFLPFVMPAFALYSAYSAFRYGEIPVGIGALLRGVPARIGGIFAVILYAFVAYFFWQTIYLESMPR